VVRHHLGRLPFWVVDVEDKLLRLASSAVLRSPRDVTFGSFQFTMLHKFEK
jgi:hypothetical protein